MGVRRFLISKRSGIFDYSPKSIGMSFFLSAADPRVEKARKTLLELRSEISELTASQVRIIAVSKTHGPERILEFLLAGQRDFGENRQNEARDKFPLVMDGQLPAMPKPIYHHIGPLQSGVARQIPGLFHYVHGVSSFKSLDVLLRAVDRYRERTDPHYLLRYLFQIDLTGEKSKAGGMKPDVLLKENTLPKTTACYPVGFMAMGPSNQDPVETRRVFCELRKLRDGLLPKGELSMGMSSDWRIAIEEGSTMIRLGTRLFGARKEAPWRPDA